MSSLSEGKNSAYAVSFRNLTLNYGKAVGIDHISLDIPAQKIVGLIGPDGVGKSTLLSLITGARAMQNGELYVLGGDMRDAAHRNRVCPDIAYMPQGLGKNLYFTLTVEENLQFFGRLFGHDAAERRKRIDRLTKSTGLYPFLNRPAGKLSGGMKQRVALLRTYLSSNGVALLDEPFSALDTITKASLHKWYLDIMQKIDLTTLFVTHDIDEAILLSDRIYILGETPATIKAEIIIKEKKPRNEDFALTKAFLEYKKNIIEQL
jgi:ribosome-dependent ATPase